MTNGSLTLEAALDRLPKVELHCHVEGTMRPATLVDLATREGGAMTASWRWAGGTHTARFVGVRQASIPGRPRSISVTFVRTRGSTR